jgi:hypothetical protein
MKTGPGMALMILVIYCFCSSIAGAQTKPNLSGTWKMNLEKSKWESLDNIRSVIVKIEHKEPHFSESVTVTTGGSDIAVEANYTTDGKETEVHQPSGAIKATAIWEGDALIIEWKKVGFHVRRKYILSADGRTLTSTGRRSTSNGEFDEISVFEKQ